MDAYESFKKENAARLSIEAMEKIDGDDNGYSDPVNKKSSKIKSGNQLQDLRALCDMSHITFTKWWRKYYIANNPKLSNDHPRGDAEMAWNYLLHSTKERDVVINKFIGEVKILLKVIESDLYHICLFNVEARSSSLIRLKDFMRKHEISESDLPIELIEQEKDLINPSI